MTECCFNEDNDFKQCNFNLLAVLSDVEVSTAVDMYDFAEDADVVQVCAQLTTAPDDGLECSIVATLLPMDGPKACK